MAYNWGNDEFDNDYSSIGSQISRNIARMTQNIQAQVADQLQRTNEMTSSITRRVHENS